MRSYQYNRKRWLENESKLSELEKLVRDAEQARRDLSKLSWITCLIEPLARGMRKLLPGTTCSILGPFGIGARTSIHFEKDGVVQHSITFEPGQLPDLRVVDGRVNTGQYKEGTIGAMNGFNYRTVSVPENATIQWFLDWMEAQREEVE